MITEVIYNTDYIIHDYLHTELMYLLGMATLQVRRIVLGLRIGWKTYFGRTSELSLEDDSPEILTEVQELPRNETVGPLKLEIHNINTKITDLEAKIIDKLAKDMENRFDEMKRKFYSPRNEFNKIHPIAPI